MSVNLAQRVGQYLSQHWETDVAIENLSRIPGGASRETYKFDALRDGVRHGLILRRDPLSTLIDTDRGIEFLAYESFHRLGIPTPAPLILDEKGGILERPFFIMSRVDGGKAAGPFDVAPYAPHQDAIGDQFFSILGRIAATPVQDLPIARALPIPQARTCWSDALTQWESAIDRDELHPQPIARAAIRSLRRRPPPPPTKIAFVHGDYRSGNFLHDGNGRILAILDWEMAHFGDPLEDLGWAIDPMWSHDDASCVAGLLPREQAIAIWERAAGLTCDPAALAWWELFNSLKGLAIWMSAARAYRDAGGIDPVLGFSGWYCARRHDAIIAARLERAFEQAQAA